MLTSSGEPGVTKGCEAKGLAVGCPASGSWHHKSINKTLGNVNYMKISGKNNSVYRRNFAKKHGNLHNISNISQNRGKFI